jgi:hypothetical protein
MLCGLPRPLTETEAQAAVRNPNAQMYNSLLPPLFSLPYLTHLQPVELMMSLTTLVPHFEEDACIRLDVGQRGEKTF